VVWTAQHGLLRQLWMWMSGGLEVGAFTLLQEMD